jgi:hypothetical protein
MVCKGEVIKRNTTGVIPNFGETQNSGFFFHAQCPAAALWSFDQAQLRIDAKRYNKLIMS